MYLTYLKNAVGKPVAKPQENSLFVEQAGKPAAEGRGDTAQENLLRMLTRKSDRPFNQYR
jgi:hypothetical protein